ncbi:MAG TPA: DUF2141 domain-containing protein [Flavisolibacter sp.]
MWVCLFSSVHAQNSVVVTIRNVESRSGVVQACIFNSAASFTGDSGTPLQCTQAPITGKEARVQFNGLPDGRYAIFVFHDANNNRKLDKNFIGIPTEGYGASRNNLPFAAAPSFDDNAFSLKGNISARITIRLRNI